MPQDHLIRELRAFYRKHGIGAEAFDCPHQRECRSGCSSFTEAREPHVGAKYGEGLPRLVVVSLDPGSADHEVGHRVIERRGTWRPGLWRARGREKTRHWYRTLEMVSLLLSPFHENLESMPVEDVEPYFAHLNSARCCQNKPGRKAADPVLFDNCRQFLAPEVEIFAPDILVTQGDYARMAVEGQFETTSSHRMSTPNGYSMGYSILRIAKSHTLWFHTYHPSMYGRFNEQRREVILPPEGMARAARDFVLRQGRSSGLSSG